MAVRVKWAVSILRVDANTSLDRLGRKAVYLHDQKTANEKQATGTRCASCLFFFIPSVIHRLWTQNSVPDTVTNIVYFTGGKVYGT